MDVREVGCVSCLCPDKWCRECEFYGQCYPLLGNSY